jgi:hypothetical protein
MASYTQYEKFDDYVQTSLIHIKLQEFINNNSIVYIIGEQPCTGFDYNDGSDDSKIINGDGDGDIEKRIISEEPFNIFNNLIHCGEYNVNKKSGRNNYYSFINDNYNIKYNNKTDISNNPTSLLIEFSQILENLYDIKSYQFFNLYQTNFIDILNLSGFIGSIILTRKIPVQDSQTNDIELYYFFINKITQLTLINFLTKEQLKTIKYLTDKITDNKFHIMPIFLTIPNNSCNKAGLYTKYIPSGNFICKLFEYGQQILSEERNYFIGKSYYYIGDRYINIFPYKNIIEYYRD